ncbi:MAG: DNA recombination protein RmuC [Ignavibacteriaceae bacterium]
MEIIYLVIGLLIGSVAVWLILNYKFKNSQGASKEEVEGFKNQINSLSLEKGRIEERHKNLEENYKTSTLDLNKEREKVIELKSEHSSLNANYNNLQQKLNEQKEELEKLQEKFTKEFENLANKILDEKSSKFTEQNKTNLESILNPLNEKIKDFEKKVNEVYVHDSKDRASLAQQIRGLSELNLQMTKEANNLTNALKGQTKTQGNWGEFILESILEKSGLEKGREYVVQESITTETGKRFQPDIIINLPENKSIIIDSKVSLVAYERFCSSDEESDKLVELKNHISSLRKHLKELGGKNYHNLYQIQTLDFVLMFLPIEPAFSLAVQNDVQIFNDAFEKNIVIVSPSTLLATLRTIASIWRQEKQNKNAIEIARQSGALYDKFTAFINDLTDVGKKINSTHESYQSAMKKLYKGRGNLVKQVENIKTLGAKATKQLPQSLLDKTDDINEVEEIKEEDKSENLFSKK